MLNLQENDKAFKAKQKEDAAKMAKLKEAASKKGPMGRFNHA